MDLVWRDSVLPDALQGGLGSALPHAATVVQRIDCSVNRFLGAFLLKQ